MSYRFRLYAHRGARLEAPENSIPAFRAALDHGATALEMDVRVTSDDEIVVIHDRDGRRVAGERELVRGLRLRELKRWRLNHPHPEADRSASGVVPTLSEVLEEFPRTPMSVDLKPNSPRLARLLVDCVVRHDASQWVTLASFNHQVIKRIRNLGYPGRTSLSRPEVALLRMAVLRPAHRLIGGQAAQIPVRVGLLHLDRRNFVERARAHGLRVDFWLVNDLERARKLVRLGATGIITDDPRALSPLVLENPNVAAEPSHGT